VLNVRRGTKEVERERGERVGGKGRQLYTLGPSREVGWHLNFHRPPPIPASSCSQNRVYHGCLRVNRPVSAPTLKFIS
jgi:hypothetical protein